MSLCRVLCAVFPLFNVVCCVRCVLCVECCFLFCVLREGSAVETNEKNRKNGTKKRNMLFPLLICKRWNTLRCPGFIP